jgi:hypothetical protein
MKATILATALFFAGFSNAWRFRGYHDRNYNGAETTASGPGAAGSACHSVGLLNNQISSFKWYNDGGCTLVLYKGTGCTDRALGVYAGNVEIPDLAGSGYNDDISSYETICT